jgi:6,7-dimethyl-8-ribityllumazine synthase
VKQVSGDLNASDLRLGFVVSRFNHSITENLLKGAVETFRRCGGVDENATVVRVPGSFEIPAAALRLARSGQVDGVVCLGCLIRGETPHFDYLSREVTRGLGQVALETGLPVTYGVITAETVEQALNRSGIKSGNKGAEATTAAVEMARLFRQLGAV